MATDTSFGEVRKFEDFLVTEIGDLPEIDVQYNDSGADVVAADAADGRYRLSLDGDNADDIAAVTFGDQNWTAGDGYLKMEARVIISAITDYSLFVGFGDTPASSDETAMEAPADVVTSGTQSDAIGILWDGDATTAQLWAVGQKADSVTVETGLGTDCAPVAATPITLGVYLSLDRKSAVFYVNGKEEHTINSDTTLITAVDLVPGVWAYDQATATNIDVDYIYAAKGRSAT